MCTITDDKIQVFDYIFFIIYSGLFFFSYKKNNVGVKIISRIILVWLPFYIGIKFCEIKMVSLILYILSLMCVCCLSFFD